MEVILLLVSMLWAATSWSYTVSGNAYRTDGSQADVQAACAAAPNDGTAVVTVPGGTYNWSGTLTIDKAVTLAGADATGVTINNYNSSGDMIRATSGANGNVNIYWLNIVQVADNGGGVGFAISADRDDSSPYTVMIHDCNFNGSKVYSFMVQVVANGILFWNDVFIGDGTNGLGGISFVCDKYGYAGWNTPDAFGTNDKTGLENSYVENCSFYDAPTGCVNCDDNSRVVIRDCKVSNATLTGHGQETSIYGAREWEIYDNSFIYSSSGKGPSGASYPLNMNSWVFVRGGTGVVANNSMENIPYNKTGIMLNVFSITRGMDDGAGGTFCPLAYPAPRQTGWGWSSTSNAEWGIGDDTNANRLVGDSSPGLFGPDGIGAVLDPIYIWGNTGTEITDPHYVGTQTFEPDNCGHGNQIATYLKEGRDYYVNEAKPDWAPYTYPHPLHTKFAVATK
jgi:hypothetical protein